MGQFLYLIPDCEGAKRAEDKILRFDLTTRAPAGWNWSRTQAPVTAGGELCGTDDAADTLPAHVLSLDAAPSYEPGQQVWHAVDADEDEPQVWLGWREGDPPGEADLRRADMRPGYPVPMGNGEAWVVPVLRPHDGHAQCREDELERLLDRLAPMHYAAVDDRREAPEDIPALPARALALAMEENYHIGGGEIAALRLLSENNTALVEAAMLDIPGYLRAHPKSTDAKYLPWRLN